MDRSHDIIIEKINELYISIDAEKEIIFEIYEHFSFFADGYQYQGKYRMGLWDGKVHLLNLRRRTLPVGLLNELLKFCKTNQYTIKAINKEDLLPKVDGDLLEMYLNELASYTKYSFTGKYQFQYDAVKYALEKQRCIILSPTACLDSKTEIEVLLDDCSMQLLKEYRTK